MPIALEVCIDCVESALAAHEGGADRVELCSALREGGITPSAGLIHAVRDTVPLGLFVLIRPRGGDFCYSEIEFNIMCDDVRRARDLGAEGVVIGLLQKNATIDVARTRKLVELARPMKVTFNKAFDAAADLHAALEDVIATGADRILTSGGARKAVDGAETLAQLVQTAKGRIILLGGGRIRNANVRSFVQTSGIREIHTSLRAYPAPDLGAHSDTEARDFVHRAITSQDVLKIRQVLDRIDPPGGHPAGIMAR